MKVNKDARHPRKKSSSFKGKVLYSVRTRLGLLTVRSAKHVSTKNVELNNVSSKKTSIGKSPAKKEVNTNDSPAFPDRLKNNKEPRLDPVLVSASFLNSIKKKWTNSQQFSNNIASLVSSPFKLVVVHRLLRENNFLEQLATELLSVPFQKFDNDLHSFKQTADLIESNIETPAISSFLQLLKGPLFSWMKEVSGKELSGKITVTGSQYKYKDHLLCHDDNLADRSIAFILYLCKDWKEDDGGALQLFGSSKQDQPVKVVRSIVPEFGMFTFFEVTTRSHHCVQEVLTKKKNRVSINGWYHGKALPIKNKVIGKGPKFNPPVPPKENLLQKFIKPYYLKPKNLVEIKTSFCDQLSVRIQSFLNDGVYAELEKALLDEKIEWNRFGPPHYRNYEIAKVSTLPPIMQDFIHLLQSKHMFHFLSEVTVDIDPDSKTTPVWHLEVQRWTPGDYSLFADGDPSESITGIDLHLFFNIKFQREGRGGTMHYIGPDKDEKGLLEESAQLPPENNSLILVAHIAGMQRIVKYINHSQKLYFHKIVGTYCQG